MSINSSQKRMSTQLCVDKLRIFLLTLLGCSVAFHIKAIPVKPLTSTHFIKKEHINSFADTAITGRVLNENGEPLEGVTVSILSTARSTATDKRGDFQVELTNTMDSLTFSFVGYTTLTRKAITGVPMNITLTPNAALGEDVVVIGYGTQKKVNLTGSVASVKSDDLTRAPVASTINSLAGRLPGLVSQQTSGRPGGDQASISIRGFGQAIWIVDGVESDFNNIDPNTIETISILKDGSASIYGARAGNGVVLVTTKRGKEGKPVIGLNSSYSLQGITNFSRPTSSAQYAELQNERFTNQGLPAQFTDEQISKFKDGSDPQYPNTDWFREAVRTWTPQHQHTVTLSGGSDKIRYFGLFGYLDQDQVWRSNGGDFKRFNVQSNIDAKVNENLSLQFNLSSIYEVRNASHRDYNTGGLWGDLWNSLPIYPATLPDPDKYSFANGGGVGNISIISDYEIAGYNRNHSQNLKGNIVATYKIKAVPGLSVRGFYNYQKTYIENKRFTKPFNFYTYDVASNQYLLAGALGTQASLQMQESKSTILTGQLSLNYDREFAKDHHITALALYEAIDYGTSNIVTGRDNYLTPAIEQLYAGDVATSQATGSATEMGRVSYVGRLNYSYKNKYLLESSLRADASAKFPAASRWGYFPSVSVGWRIDQENFLDFAPAISELKLRGSYGSSGLDNVGNFSYLSGYQFNGQWLLDGNSQLALATTGLANPDLTWETVEIYNAGVDFSINNGKIFGTVEAFYRLREGIPGTRVLTLPNTFGAALPQENINSQNNRGFEILLGTRGRRGDFQYEISGNISWTRGKWGYYEQQIFTDPDQIRLYKLAGRWLDVAYGYKSDGLFTSQQEIDALKFNYPAGNAGLKPGDIKYVDKNADGILDWKDQEVIGKGTVPQWMGGLNFNLKYKNFDLTALLQGAFGYYSYITLLQGNLNYSQAVYDLRWSEKNNDAGAFYPRLGGAASNGFTSDHFYRNANYLRLKTFSVGYTLPQTVLERINFKTARVFLAGTNLVTLSSLNQFGIDPEAPSGISSIYYPQMRTISLGVNLSF
ncbi:MAG: TonB-dependent receptor [Flavitalea sp.]